jgi:hypothetical protein
MSNKKQFLLHIMYPEPDLEPMKVILPVDGTNGLVIGEDWEVRQVYEMLGKYLADGKHDGEIPSYHKQLGTKWIVASEALSISKEKGCSSLRTIRWAAKNGYIKGAEKRGRDWQFPLRSLLYWLEYRPKRGRKE